MQLIRRELRADTAPAVSARLLNSVACQAVLPETLDEAIEASFFLNSFRAAAEASGYEDALYDPDFKGTIFAPVDLVRH